MNAVLSALIEARPLMLRGDTYANCIGSTKVALEVLEHFGIDAKAAPVDCVILNAAYVNEMEAGTLDPNDRATWSDDAYSLGIGFWKPGDAAGHLVAVAGDVLIDMSLDQASRPEHGINLKPIAVEIDRARFDGGMAQGPTIESMGGVYVGYRRAAPAPAWWTTSPNWGRRDAAIRRSIVAKIVRRIKKEAT